MSKFTVLAALILVVTACFVVSSSVPVGAAPVSEDKGKWEYKAVSFYVEHENPSKHTDQLNGLAAGGWEYVGIILPPNYSNDRYRAKSVVAFRRPK